MAIREPTLWNQHICDAVLARRKAGSGLLQLLREESPASLGYLQADIALTGDGWQSPTNDKSDLNLIFTSRFCVTSHLFDISVK